MSRYIDADALKRQIESPYTEYSVMIQIRKAIKEFIDDAPSIDIVFCKECKRRENCEQHVLISEMFCEVEESEPIDFCSYGEREGE